MQDTNLPINHNPQQIGISFLGDISLNDEYNELYQRRTRPFDEVREILGSSDLVVGNLECMARGNKGENVLKKPRLKTEQETLNYLMDLNLGLACLAHNHVYDNLEDGFCATTDFLLGHNIKYTGASISSQPIDPFIFSNNGVSVAILNYVTKDTNPNIPPKANVFPNWFSLDKASLDIKALKEYVDHVVLSVHWGGIMEGALLPEPNLVQLAHELINAGADLIVGHHSHTLQPFEIYKGKYVFYSLGNFCFSNIISDGKLYERDQKRGNESIILKVLFTSRDYSIFTYPITNEKHYIKLGSIKSTATLPDIRAKRFWYNTALAWNTYFLYEKKIYPILLFFFGKGRNPFRQLAKVKPTSIIKHLKRKVL
jgi:hypothetical protein